MTEQIEILLAKILASKNADEPLEVQKQLLASLTLHAVKLRIAAKQVVGEVEDVRAETSALRTEVDEHDMQLQSLLYEKNHYKKEIASCRGFKSKYTDEEIGLIPEAEFHEKAPDSLKTGTSDPHELQLQRLAHEKQERLDLLSQLEALRQSKEAVNQVVAGKRKQLDDVQQDLKAARDKAKPIFDLLNLKPTSRANSRDIVAGANQLPAPLFVLFHQGTAVKEAFGTAVEFSIEGSEKQAEAWSLNEGAAVFRRGGQSGQPPKKRRKSDAKGALSGAPETLTPHSMSVVMKVPRTGGQSLTMQFLYLPHLETVTVRASDPLQQQILGNLYPDDSGLALPSEAAQQILSQQNLEFGLDRLDRPYMWAQHMCGLDALPSLSPTGQLLEEADRPILAQMLLQYRKQERIQTLLQRMQAATPPPEATPSTPVVEQDTLLKASPKRIRTWEEVVAQREKEALAKAAETYAANAALRENADTKNDDVEIVEDENEEGELPDE